MSGTYGVGPRSAVNTRARVFVAGSLAAFAWVAAGGSATAPVFATSAVAPADLSVQVETEAPTDSITVGERIRVRYTVLYADTLEFLPPDRFDPGNCRVLSMVWRERAGGAVGREAELTAITVDLSEARIPPLPLYFLTAAGDTLTAWTDAVRVPVRALTTAPSETRPLKPQWQAPRDWSFLWWFAAGAAAIAIALWLWRRRRHVVVVSAPPPRLPADYVAMQALQRIETAGWLESGDMRRFYTETVDVVRHYLEARFAVPVLDATTTETLENLGRVGVHIDGLEPLLGEADLVKFARFTPDAAAAGEALERARGIVAASAPRPKVSGE